MKCDVMTKKGGGNKIKYVFDKNYEEINFKDTHLTV